MCSHNVEVRQDVLESALVDALVEILDERVLEAAVERALMKIREEQLSQPSRHDLLERELALVETRLRHLVEAVARGEGSDALFAGLRVEEGRKKVLLDELGTVQELGQVVSMEPRRVAFDLRSRLGDVKGLLTRHIAQARQMLGKLIEAPAM